jgi:Fe-S cluster biosynthesis and repair protein YggX
MADPANHADQRKAAQYDECRRPQILSEMDKFLNNEDFDKAEGYVPESE